MASPPVSSVIPVSLVAWTGAGAGAVAALMTVAEAPVTAAFALAAGAASGWIAWRSGHEDEPRPMPVRLPALQQTSLMELTPLLEALPDPALLIGADGRVAGSNRAARGKFAFEAAGLRLSSILRQPNLLEAVDAALAGETRTIEFETAGQVDEHVRCYVAPVHWSDTSAALIVFHDETARIATEQMRADFLANASHELKTPLAALMILIETIAGPARDNEADRNRFLGLMQVQADRMRRLIEDLLSLSRIELDEHVPPSDRADFAIVTREAMDALSGVAAERNVTLELAGLAAAPVIGHPFQLVQVMQNLIDNAIKYAKPGGKVRIIVGEADDRDAAVLAAGRQWGGAGRIALLTPPPAAARAYAYARVEDDGPGIAQRYLPKLGARFFRVEREEGDEKGGTGLGLAIVKHIINRHRGGLLVESEPGRGSAFAAYVEAAPEP